MTHGSRGSSEVVYVGMRQVRLTRGGEASCREISTIGRRPPNGVRKAALLSKWDYSNAGERRYEQDNFLRIGQFG